MSRRPFKPQAAQRRDATLPKTFKCATCDVWKPSFEFSQNQHAKWHRMKKHENDGITAESIGLTCKEHGPGEPEIKCAGPCGKSKVRSQFSNSQRNKRNAWCMVCTDWKIRHPGEEIPDAAPNEEVTVDQISGRIAAYADGNNHGVDHYFSDSDVSIDSSDLSEEDTDDELDDQDAEFSNYAEDREDEDYYAHGNDNGRGPASVFSAYQSTNSRREHDEEDATSTIGAGSAKRSSLFQPSTATTKVSARGKGKAITTERHASYATDSDVSQKARADTQVSSAANDAQQLPPHLRHFGLPGANTNSNVSRGSSSSRHSKGPSNFQNAFRSSSTTSAALSETTVTDHAPNLYNATVFTPQGDVFTRTIGSGSQNQKSGAATSTTKRSSKGKFFKGDTRAVFYAPRPFAKMLNDRTEPSSHIEDPEYSGDSSDDF